MRITALVKSHDHVCCRYRMAAFRGLLENAGHRFEIQPWSRRWFLHQILPNFSVNADVLIVQRKLFPAWQLKLLRRRVPRLVYDFDDSIFLRTSYNPRGQDCPRRFQQFKQMMHAADAVIAGNDFLRDQAIGFTQAHKVHVIPTCVDVGRYALACHEAARGHVQLVWIGSASTLRGLEKIRTLLDFIGKKHSRLELKIICDRSLTLQHLPVQFCPWQEQTETAELARADIGICWMPDDAWSEGKCGLKVLQYMSAGLPVVANPVGVHMKMVRHGETGFLVETPDDWVQAIHLLANDPELRRTMGLAGRRLVEREFQLAGGETAWARVLRSLSAPVRSGVA
jgi:glycosyltransferase involved in cell wall biosynthesis